MQLKDLNEIFMEEYPGFTGFEAAPSTIHVRGFLNGKEILILGYDASCQQGKEKMFADIRMQLNGASFGRDGQLVDHSPAKGAHRKGK